MEITRTVTTTIRTSKLSDFDFFTCSGDDSGIDSGIESDDEEIALPKYCETSPTKTVPSYGPCPGAPLKTKLRRGRTSPYSLRSTYSSSSSNGVKSVKKTRRRLHFDGPDSGYDSDDSAIGSRAVCPKCTAMTRYNKEEYLRCCGCDYVLYVDKDGKVCLVNLNPDFYGDSI